MAFFDDVGYDMDGAPYGDPPLADNSWGEPPMQSTTPLATGTGQVITTDWASAALGVLDKGLNYALMKDQMEFAAKHGYSATPTPYTATPQAAAQASNSRLILLALLVGGVAFAMRGK